MFRPSPYSQRLSAHPAFDHPVSGEFAGPRNKAPTKDVAKGVGGAVSAGAAGVKAGSLLAAGGAAATVPVAGWVVGGVLAAAAGTVAIIQGVKKRKVSKRQALAWARSMKLPKKDAEDLAGFVLRLSRKDRAWRQKQAKRLSKRLAKIKKRQQKWKRRPGGQRVLQVLSFGIKRGPDRLKNQRKRTEAKLGLIAAVDGTLKRRRIARKKRRQSGRTSGSSFAPATTQTGMSALYGGVPLWAWLAVGGAAMVGSVLYARRKP